MFCHPNILFCCHTNNDVTMFSVHITHSTFTIIEYNNYLTIIFYLKVFRHKHPEIM